MKKLFLIFCSLLFSLVYSQKNTNYVFNVELSDRSIAPTFSFKDGFLIYNGSNNLEAIFFANYSITKFYQTYPSSKVSKSLNMFTFETSNSTLMNDLIQQFPNKYLVVEDLTGRNIELLYYPNDYGSTSPVTNLGANLSLKSFDYIDVPKAWDFFPNSKGNVTIGISDGKVNTSDPDFIGNVSYLHEDLFYYSNFGCPSHPGQPYVNGDSWHGVGVAAIAAAKGNNGNGIAGICYDCNMINIPYTMTYNGLLDLANAGVKVINMSWAYMYSDDLTYENGYYDSQQEIINQVHNMGVVMVAGAGNASSYSASAPNYHRYGYPSSYNHVISVTVVQAKNANFADEVTTEQQGQVSWYNEDIISPTGVYQNGVFTSNYEGTTTNARVDICAPGYAPIYPSYLLGCLEENGNPFLYSTSTSSATPYISGTAALMLSLNSCLNPDEVEDILQLSSKNIESNPANHMYVGKIGSGKLETGDAVEFVHEAMDINGNAIIDGQDFWRFNFDLSRINNKLTISNQRFRDSNTSNFVAKNSIEVNTNSDFKPNSNGFIDLKINSQLEICNSSIIPVVDDKIQQQKRDFRMETNMIKLFPNPNNGNFTISVAYNKVENLNIEIFDVLGKSIYKTISNDVNTEIATQNLPNGLYLVKLTSNTINEVLKFVKK